MMEIKLGKNLTLNKPIMLAPIDGYTDIPFRLITKEMNPDLMYTEFVNSDSVIHANERSLRKVKILEEERPVAIQLFGRKPENMAIAAKMLEELNPEIIDLNFGCPSPTVANHGSGAALLKDLDMLKRICEEVVKAVKVPVTAKTRIGWDFDSINILETKKIFEDTGIKMITLHPRTRNQKFKGLSDWSYIKLLKENTFLPVIGNGDIKTPEDAKRMFDETNCDGVMIAREAIKNPWLFKQINDFFDTGEYEKEISLNERIRLCLKHFDYSLEYKHEKRAQFEMRKLYPNYFRGISNIKRFKRLVYATTDIKEIKNYITNLESILEDESIDNRELNPVSTWN